MALHPDAGKAAQPADWINVPRLVSAYYMLEPDHGVPEERVSFGTSGHRGSSLKRAFNEGHILAITQAICEHRRTEGVDGPLFLGMDTHALSEPALNTALEVLEANGVETIVQRGRGVTPTPVISHAILTHNRIEGGNRSDGVVITPSHNPPDDGGVKYNPPSGGPAGSDETSSIQNRANQLLEDGLGGVKRTPYARAVKSDRIHDWDFVQPYVEDLGTVVDMEAIASSGLRLGVDPLGGSSLPLWEPIAERWGLELTVVNRTVDPRFGFMTLDKDGKIRMDCSSPYAMASLIGMKDQFDVAVGSDPDGDRHGIVTPSSGLLNPNHYLSALVWYLLQNRSAWSPTAAVAKTLVTSSMVDRVVDRLGRKLFEVPVGFKWFVPGLLDGEIAFAGEESAGASLLRRDGGVWTTDKDGLVLGLLAAEMTARLGKDPGVVYRELEGMFGQPVYERIDAPATPEQKAKLKQLSADDVKATELAGEPIRAKLTRAAGNDQPIGGLKVVTESGWFAARPSGTEDVYKIYAESFQGVEHLHKLQQEAQAIVDRALA